MGILLTSWASGLWWKLSLFYLLMWYLEAVTGHYNYAAGYLTAHVVIASLSLWTETRS